MSINVNLYSYYSQPKTNDYAYGYPNYNNYEMYNGIGNRLGVNKPENKTPLKKKEFSFWNATKNFIKGIISPFTVMFRHPFKTLGTLAGIGLACFMVPVLTPIITVGFGALSVFHLGKAIYNTSKNIANKKYAEAEKEFENIGSGVTATALSALGIKQGARIAAEAKLAAVEKVTALNAAQKAQAMSKTVSQGFAGALKEQVTLLTTKNGYKAIFNQLRPEALKQRFNLLKDLRYMFCSPTEKFKRSPEGLRRSSLTEEQVETEIVSRFNKAFDELGVPQGQRPRLIIKKSSENSGGFYCKNDHTITVNPESYRSGVFEIDDVLMHEATHAKEAILRANVPQDKVDAIIADNLSSRIINGDSEEILLGGGSILGPGMMKTPKMPVQMRKEYAQFAQRNLFNTDKKLWEALSKCNHEKLLRRALQEELELARKSGDTSKIAGIESAIQKNTAELQQYQSIMSPIERELQTILDRYPEFVKQYKSPEEAMSVLERYSLANNTRYNYFTNNKINGLQTNPLTAEQIAQAEKSLIDNIDTIEGNANISGLRGTLGIGNFDHYQFSPEEVLAQQNGNRFLINNYKTQLQQMRANGTLTPEKEAFLTNAIAKAEDTITYKTMGSEYFKLCQKLKNNPSDLELARQVANMKKILQYINPDGLRNVYPIVQLADYQPAAILAIADNISRAI